MAGVFLRMVLLTAFAAATVLAPGRVDARGMGGGTGCPDSMAMAAAGSIVGAGSPDGGSAAAAHGVHASMTEAAHPVGRGHAAHADHRRAVIGASEQVGAADEEAFADDGGFRAGQADARGAPGQPVHHHGAKSCCGADGCRMGCHVPGLLAGMPRPFLFKGVAPREWRERPDPAALTVEVAVPPPRALG